MIKTGKLKVVLSVAKAIGCIIAGLVGFAGLYILWWVMAFIGLGIGLVSLWERKKRERDCG